MKKIISIISALAITFASFNAFASVDIVPDRNWGVSEQSQAFELYEGLSGIYTLMKHLGIATKAKNEFNADAPATRGDAVDMLVRILQEPVKATKKPYDDVVIGDKYIDAIATAKSLGILEETSGKFNPYNNITATDAAIMGMRILGYTKEVAKGYENTILENLKLLKGIKNAELTNGELCVLISNILDASPFVLTSYNGKSYTFSSDMDSYLKYYHNIEKQKGLVTAKGVTSLYTENALLDGRVEINRQSYWGAENVDDSLIGKNVYFYVNDEGKILGAWEDLKNNYTLSVKESYVENLYIDRVEYLNTKDNIKDLDIDPAAILIENGIKKGAYVQFYPTLIDYSTLIFIDNTNDGYADVIFAESYNYYVVESYSPYSEVVKLQFTDTILNFTKTNCDGYNITYNGEVIAADDLKKDDVLSVGEFLKANGKKYYNIKVSRNAITSKYSSRVEDFDDTYFIIDDKEYELSVFYKDFLVNNVTEPKPALNEEAKFFVSHDGKIVLSKITANTFNFAYLIKAYIDDLTFNDEIIKIKMYTMDGRMVTYELSDRIKFYSASYLNGQRMDAIDALGSIQSNVQKMVAFKVKDDKITDFAIEYDMTDMSATYTAPGSLDYPIIKNAVIGAGANTRLYTGVIMGWKILWTSDILEVPANVANISDPLYYKKYTASTFGTEKYFTDADLVVYNADKFNVAGFSVTKGNGGADLDRKIASYMVKRVTRSLDEYGEPGLKVTYLDAKGAEKTLMANAETQMATSAGGDLMGTAGYDYNDLHPGDVIQFASLNGKISILRIVFKADDATVNTYRAEALDGIDFVSSGTTNNWTNPFKQLGLVYGRCLDISNDAAIVDLSSAENETNVFTVFLDSENWYQLQTPYTLYDSAKGEVSAVTQAEIKKGDKILLKKHYNLTMDVYIIR